MLLSILASAVLAPADVITYTTDHASGSRLKVQGMKVASVKGAVYDPSISPDRKWVAYWGEESQDPASQDFAPLFVADLRTGKSRRLLNGNTRSPLWTPDGKSLFFTQYSKTDEDWTLYNTSLSAPKPVPILGKSQGTRGLFSPAWTPGNSALLIQDMEHVYWVDPDGVVTRKVLVELLAKDRGYIASSDRFCDQPGNPDLVAFSRQAEVDKVLQENEPGYAIFLYDLKTHTRKRLTPKSVIALNPTWSRSGKSLYYEGQQIKGKKRSVGIWRVDVNGGNNKLIIPGGRDPRVG